VSDASRNTVSEAAEAAATRLAALEEELKLKEAAGKVAESNAAASAKQLSRLQSTLREKEVELLNQEALKVTNEENISKLRGSLEAMQQDVRDRDDQVAKGRAAIATHKAETDKLIKENEERVREIEALRAAAAAAEEKSQKAQQDLIDQRQKVFTDDIKRLQAAIKVQKENVESARAAERDAADRRLEDQKNNLDAIKELELKLTAKDVEGQIKQALAEQAVEAKAAAAEERKANLKLERELRDKQLKIERDLREAQLRAANEARQKMEALMMQQMQVNYQSTQQNALLNFIAQQQVCFFVNLGCANCNSFLFLREFRYLPMIQYVS
jgi:hypothetical protein